MIPKTNIQKLEKKAKRQLLFLCNNYFKEIPANKIVLKVIESEHYFMSVSFNNIHITPDCLKLNNKAF
jgi:hypothetical protein